VSGPGAPFAATARADRTAAALGEPFTIEVLLRHGAEDRWTLDAAQDAAPLALRSAGCETAASGGEALTRCAVVAARVDLGGGAPELRLRGAGPDGTATFTLRAPEVRAALVTDPATPASRIPLAGMSPPLPLLVPTWQPLAWGGAGLLLAVALALAARRALRRPRPRPPAPASPAAALRAALAAIERERPAGRELWFRLAGALSAYVAAALALPAPALTGGELVERVRRAPVPGLEPDELAAFFAQADLARFARGEPPEEEAARALAAVRAIAAGAPP
jgi:hypothetical protein